MSMGDGDNRRSGWAGPRVAPLIDTVESLTDILGDGVAAAKKAVRKAAKALTAKKRKKKAARPAKKKSAAAKKPARKKQGVAKRKRKTAKKRARR